MNIDHYPRLRLPVEQDIDIDFFDFWDTSNLLDADVVVMEGSAGFNQLGASLEHISKSLAIGFWDLRRACDWNTNENEKLSLVIARSNATEQRVKGVALVPTPLGLVYKRHVGHVRNVKPYRDFFYTVVFESLRRLNYLFAPKHLAIGVLIGNWVQNKNIDACMVNAIVDFILTDANQLNHISFVGHKYEDISKAINTISAEAKVPHREVKTQLTKPSDIAFNLTEANQFDHLGFLGSRPVTSSKGIEGRMDASDPRMSALKVEVQLAKSDQIEFLDLIDWTNNPI